MASNTSISQSPIAGAANPRAARQIAIWLLVMCGLTAAMVIVGGATRLTDSGLSITEWRPVTGAIPPLSEAAWQAEFEKYKIIPEYTEVNYGMSLDQFKTIYWWEWGHRLLGRLIGAAFFIPFVYFLVRRMTSRRLTVQLAGLFLLGGLQGALGWWMVSSGLADRVDVSQYRLAAHLSLALILFGLMFWLALDLWPSSRIKSSPNVRLGAIALLAGVFSQMVLGAFVAGLRAGRTYNTWPLMDGKVIPDGYFSGTPGLNDLFESIAAVQFNHRIGAYAIALGALSFWFWVRKSDYEPRARLVLAAIGLQFVIGVWTVLAATPISLGLLHQFGALIVFAAAIFNVHGLSTASALGAKPKIA